MKPSADLEQLRLDDVPNYRQSDPMTSRAAGESMKPVLRQEQQRVLDALCQLGTGTAYEVRCLLADGGVVRQQNCVAKRCSELVELGMIRASGTTRPGSSNRQLMAWVPTATGWRTAEEVAA